VTLAGDAHPMTYRTHLPFFVVVFLILYLFFLALLTSSERGQGLNHSITDAGKLVSLLTSEKNQKSAIENYENEMRDRAGEEVRVSLVKTTMLHGWEKVMKSLVMTAGMKDT
jgi:hypothetical protein